MSTVNHVDLAILGGGCAGLSIARELSTQAIQKSVVVIEPRESYQDDRSWCFWAAKQHTLSRLVSHVWPDWLFGRHSFTVKTRSCPGYPYQYVRSADFYQDSLNIIAQSPSIKVRTGLTVTAVERNPDGWRVVTPQETYIAAQVIDTRPPPSELIEKATLFQCFLGVEIQLDPLAKIDIKQLELMTDMRLVNEEFCFSYILPLASDRLLVEVTFFARHVLTQDDLHDALTQLLSRRGWGHAKILRTEYGNLPMGLALMHTPTVAGPNQLVHAGTRGGALRPSSGYAFLRIQRWAEQCASQYAEQGTLYTGTGSGFWLQQMDQLFLAVIKNNPALAPILFDRLLSIEQTERFLRFMDDRASFFDCLHVIHQLPKAPFIKALLSKFW